MFHISSIFYPKHFRQLIAQLKNEGTFRDRPLRELDRYVYSATALGVGACAIFYIGGKPLPVEGNVAIFLMMVFACYVDIRVIIREIIIPYTIGTIRPFLLPEEPFYVWPSRLGWVVRYILYDDAGNLGKEYRAKGIQKRAFDKAAFMSSPYEALVDPQNIDCNYPRIPHFEEVYRMTTVPLPPPAVPTEDDYI